MERKKAEKELVNKLCLPTRQQQQQKQQENEKIDIEDDFPSNNKVQIK